MEEKKAHSAGPSRAQLPSNPACPVRPGFGAPLGGAATGVAHPPLGALARAEQTIPSLLDGAAWNSEDRGERTDKLGRRCGAAILRRLLSTKP
eukprot:COSAG03_NODE_431_length_7966_cov_4.105123_5_plen_93_part_00